MGCIENTKETDSVLKKASVKSAIDMLHEKKKRTVDKASQI